jgi:hypothetical protein
MSQTLQLQVPKPCHENWNNMTNQEKGRFCSSCQKMVVDFSLMSDQQIINYFSNQTGKICGRLHTNQLNRTLTIPQQRKWSFKYFVQFMVPAFLISIKTQARNSLGSISDLVKIETSFNGKTTADTSIKKIVDTTVQQLPSDFADGFAGTTIMGHIRLPKKKC